MASPQLQLEPEVIESPVVRWPFAARAAFRLCAIYFALFCLTTQVITGIVPFVDVPDPSAFAPVRPVVFWTAQHVFHVTKPLVYKGSGSGDKTFDWVLAFCALALAAIGTAIWSALDRKRLSYATAYKWFYLGIRVALGSQMLIYGFAKIVPLQMPFPFLTRLVEPYGNFSPMGVLWASIGASPAYEMFAGSAEAIGGMLLFFPRAALLGALICFVDLVEVFTLNMTYDVPVKLFAFHLILMSAILIAPEWRRLLGFISNRAVEASTSRDLFASLRANRISMAAQVLFGLLLISANGYGSWQGWHNFGAGAAKSPLYGIWNIEPGASANYRRVVFEVPTRLAFQKQDDTFDFMQAKFDVASGTLAIGKTPDLVKVARAGNDLTMDGNLNGQPLHLRAHLLDRNSMMLVKTGFHWIQEFPVNR